MSSLLHTYVERLTRVLRKRLFWPVVFALFILYACLPLLGEQSVIESARSSSATMSAMESSKARVKSEGLGSKDEGYLLHNATPFSQVSIPYRTSWDTDRAVPIVRSEMGSPNLSLRLDRIALVGAMIIILALTISTLYAPSEIVAASIMHESPPNTTPQPNSTARQVFVHEVKHAELRAETLFKRSTYLLTGGVLMAFVGVAVFYATLPEVMRDEEPSSYLIRAFRSAGMLVFLEAIAWFLLRQYRNLIEDFKSFHRIYMKRANYLAAITILDKESIRPADLLLVGALLGEDFSGKLSSGQTTESLETIRNEAANPVFNLVHDALEKLFSRTPADKSPSLLKE